MAFKETRQRYVLLQRGKESKEVMYLLFHEISSFYYSIFALFAALREISCFDVSIGWLWRLEIRQLLSDKV
jgi:hypothetical protein